MRNSRRTKKRYNVDACASCGRSFGKNEMKVSYDFERFYCFSCDDKS